MAFLSYLHSTTNNNFKHTHFFQVAKFSINFFQSAKHEESLSSELQALKDQVNLKRSSMNEHVSHLENLREEVRVLMRIIFVITSGCQVVNIFADQHYDGPQDGTWASYRVAPGWARRLVKYIRRVCRQDHHAGEANERTRQHRNNLNMISGTVG